MHGSTSDKRISLLSNISAANDKGDESEEEAPAQASKPCDVEEDDAFNVLFAGVFGKETSSLGLPCTRLA